MMLLIYLFLIAAALCIIRLALGPTAPDRVIALDAIGSVFIAILVVLSIEYGKSMLLDVALAFSLLSFIGAIVISKYLEGDKLFK